MSTFLKRTSPLIFRSILSTFIFVLNSVLIFDVTLFAIEVCTEGIESIKKIITKKSRTITASLDTILKKFLILELSFNFESKLTIIMPNH